MVSSPHTNIFHWIFEIISVRSSKVNVSIWINFFNCCLARRKFPLFCPVRHWAALRNKILDKLRNTHWKVESKSYNLLCLYFFNKKLNWFAVIKRNLWFFRVNPNFFGRSTFCLKKYYPKILFEKFFIVNFFFNQKVPTFSDKIYHVYF